MTEQVEETKELSIEEKIQAHTITLTFTVNRLERMLAVLGEASYLKSREFIEAIMAEAVPQVEEFRKTLS